MSTMMTPEQVELQDEQGAEFGDPRRCPRHPGQITSSPDGMFDAPCGACEAEADGYGYLDSMSDDAVASFGVAGDDPAPLPFGKVDWDAEDYRDEVGF